MILVQKQRRLEYDINSLSGTVPPSLFNMSSLKYLGMANNSLIGKLPSDIGYTLPNIQDLILPGNKFEGSFPASLLHAYNLRWLDIANNSLIGFIPFFGSLPNLEKLDMSYNMLEADDWGFRSSLSNCSRLTALLLEGMNHHGNLPRSIEKLLISMEELWLKNNKISGPIPPEIGNLKNLDTVFMDYNLFTGNIPPAIANLHSSVYLALAQTI